LEGKWGEVQGCIKRYPKDKKRMIGIKKSFLRNGLKIILHNINPPAVETSRYAHTLYPGTASPKTMPDIMDIKRGIIGREYTLSIIP
jgi:hypothetical protein